MVNYKVNSSENTRKLLLYHLNYAEHQCDRRCFSKTFGNEEKDHFRIVVIKNAEKFQDKSVI